MAKGTGRNSLQAQVMQAVSNYQSTWRGVDAELYGLCRRRPSHHTFDDVYTKVAIIGRVYAVSITRSSRASVTVRLKSPTA